MWLLAGLGFVVAANGVAMQEPWALRVTMFMVAASFVLCAVGWLDSRIGLVVNVGLAVLLLVNARWPVVAVVR